MVFFWRFIGTHKGFFVTNLTISNCEKKNVDRAWERGLGKISENWDNLGEFYYKGFSTTTYRIS